MPLLDEYKDEGVWLRRWSLVAGHPRCLEDAVALDHPDANAIRARNDRVRDAITIVRPYEAAQRLIAQVEAGNPPAETILVPVLVDSTEEQPNPAWRAYQDAVALVASTDDTTRALALIRATAEPPTELLDDGSSNPARATWDAAMDLMEAINAGE